MKCTVKILWDPEAAVWITKSEELPGLLLESGSYDALIERVKHAISDFIDVDEIDKIDYCDINFVGDRLERVLVS